MTQVLERTTFTRSRLGEYFSERELTYQTGASYHHWCQVILKELLDNSLDACEDSRMAPQIQVRVVWEQPPEGFLTSRLEAPLLIEVADNGPGIPAEVVERILDYSTRTSDKQVYVSPTRGAQGNALKAILGIPYVLSRTDPKAGLMVIESRGVRHTVVVRFDTIASRPVLAHLRDTLEEVRTGGTRVKVWVEYARLHDRMRPDFYDSLAASYLLLNPHMALHLEDLDGQAHDSPAADAGWQKWRPSDPTSPHWYSPEALGTLIAAHIAHARDYGGRDLSVREFVQQFRGLSGTRKAQQVFSAIPPTLKRLSQLADGNGLHMEVVATLLAEMRKASRPVKTETLGVLGPDALATRLGVDDVKYALEKGEQDGLSFVVEAAMAHYPDADGDDDADRRWPAYTYGLNFAPVLSGDPFESWALSHKDVNTQGVMAFASRMEAHHGDRVHLVVHLAMPGLTFTDRGKTDLADMGSQVRDALARALYRTLREWRSYKRALKRDHRRAERTFEVVRPPRREPLRDIVFAVLPEAIRQASANGALPFTARQLYYKVRPLIQGRAEKTLRYDYFTPQLLTEYEELHGRIGGLCYDARGELVEPHSGQRTETGTRGVDSYHVPPYEFNKVIYAEKKHLETILAAARFPQRYDVAFITAEGFGQRDAKRLIQMVLNRRIPVLVIHDCDPSGYEIARTLAQATRTYKRELDVRDLGLRVADARTMGLDEEFYVGIKPPSRALWQSLTKEEREFLFPQEASGDFHRGARRRRVELDAMDSGQLVAWLERKLGLYGLLPKVQPPHDIVADTVASLVASRFDTMAQAEVMATVERLLGVSFGQLESQVKEIWTRGCVLDDLSPALAQYLGQFPTDNWREWLDRKAGDIAGSVVGQMADEAYRLVKDRLG
ncbi:MAG: hypothetical protein Q8O40_13310 [Chloroflexota bacterium]|nr:hypothetical protein [Chloroflexota bacterium]